MAMQTPDQLRHNGLVFAANAEEALTAYFATRALSSRPALPAPLAEYVRSYQSTWDIRNDRLYLVKLEPLSQSDAGAKLHSPFLSETDGVIAEWFPGVIYVDDEKVNIHAADVCPLTGRPIVALEFERGLFGLVRLLPGTRQLQSL